MVEDDSSYTNNRNTARRGVYAVSEVHEVMVRNTVDPHWNELQLHSGLGQLDSQSRSVVVCHFE